MRNQIALWVLLTMVCALPMAQAEEPTELPQLRDAVNGFYDSIEAGDPEARIVLLADDVILMPNHWTLVQGKEAG